MAVAKLKAFFLDEAGGCPSLHQMSQIINDVCV